MERQVVYVGSVVVLAGGQRQDVRRRVEFVGQCLASRVEFEYDCGVGVVTDTRGRTETLYELEDGRYLVHVEQFSRWQGEPSVQTLRLVDREDLVPGGEFEDLGYEARLWTSLSLNQALSSFSDRPEG